MNLTTKQEKFCITYVTEGCSLSDAYRAAYNCEKMKPESVNRKAAELMANGKVSARINELGRKQGIMPLLRLKSISVNSQDFVIWQPKQDSSVQLSRPKRPAAGSLVST